MFESVKRLCDSFIENGMPWFDLSVCQDGKEILRYADGFSDVENGVRVNGKERFNLYSCSKVITCVAAMQLWEKGAFSLDDRLSDYLPEFENMTVKTEDGIRPAKRPILIHNLFEMTSGLTYDRATENMLRAIKETGGKCPTREVMKYLALDPLAFDPGDKWLYGLSHDVLAALVEVLSGQKFDDYINEHIFAPLGMKDTAFVISKEERATLAPLYDYDPETKKAVSCGPEIPSYVIGTEYAAGGAGGVSSVDDYMKFIEGIRTRKLLKDGTVRLMKTDRLTDEQRPYFTMRSTHGYGLGIRCRKKDGILDDYGWGGAAGSWLAIDDERKLSIFFGTHIAGSPFNSVRSYLYRFVLADLYGTFNAEELFDTIRKSQKYIVLY